MRTRDFLAIAVISVAAIGSGQSGSAADLPRKAPVAPIVAAPAVTNWTGFYVGGHAGWIRSDVDAAVTFPGLVFDPFATSFDASGLMLGGQLGVNYQIGSWVLGLEADLSWTNLDGGTTRETTPFLVLVGPINYTATQEMDWFGTVRGRIGFAANNLLIYATGGVAFAELDASSAMTLVVPPPVFVGSASTTKAGWTLGGGLEWAFAPNWSMKGEYLYYDLGDTTLTTLDPTAPGTAVVTRFDNTGHILRLGVNYRFGYGAPVVARY
jgi:outer membrane immunogenic protein